MAYVTGSVSSLADLLTAIRTACTTNGWTLNGNVLSKGGSAHTRIQVSSGHLQILGGTGVDGSNNLTGAAASPCHIISSFPSPLTLTYPLTYHIHINTAPDEVYVVINYSTAYFQWLAFGKSAISLPGTGNWYAASRGQNIANLTGINGTFSITPTSGGGAGSGLFVTSGAPFWTVSSYAGVNGCVNSFIHHNLNGEGWSTEAAIDGTSGVGGMANAIITATSLVAISPNAWNGESVLLPIPVVVGRPSTMRSLVLQPGHARFVRNDNYSDGQVITLGSDQWKVYPFVSKNAASRNGGSIITHSGTFAWALRYTP